METTTCNDMLKRLESLQIVSEVVSVLEAHKQQLAELQKGQWKKGKRSTGSPIGKYKSGAYAYEKYQMNPDAGAGFIDLMLTKATINSLEVDVTEQSIVFRLGSDEHELVGRYGENILGMNQESRTKIINDWLRKELLNSIRFKTGMK